MAKFKPGLFRKVRVQFNLTLPGHVTHKQIRNLVIDGVMSMFEKADSVALTSVQVDNIDTKVTK